MSNKILLLDGDQAHARSLARVLRSAGPQVKVEILPGLSEISPEHSWDMLLANYDFLCSMGDENLMEALSSLKARGQLIIYSAPLAKNRDKLISLLGKLELTNFLARNVEVDAEDLLITVQKIIRKDIFGLAKYFSWGARSIDTKIRSSEDRAEVIAMTADLASKVGVQARLANLFCTVVDELITNAIYDAPVDAEGRHRFAHYHRSQQVTLEPDEEIEISLACDGRRLGVAVADPFGSLSTQKVLEYLTRCFRKGEDQIEKKDGGSGLGLYYTFEALSHFAINISQGRKTEAIGLLDIRGSYKDFALRGKSFNVFVE